MNTMIELVSAITTLVFAGIMLLVTHLFKLNK